MKTKLPRRMRFKIWMLCLACTMTALLLQTWLFNRTSSSLIYNQAKKESFSLLQNMQDDLYSIIKSVESNMIKVYNHQPLIEDLRDGLPIAELKDSYYREAYNIAMENFDTADGVVALYLYNMKDEIISTYRRATTPRHNYPLDIYQEMEENNAGIVKQYAHSGESTMLVTSYYNPYRETDLVRFTMKIYNNNNKKQVLGYLVCDIDSKIFRYRMEKFVTDSDMFIWLQPLNDRAAVQIGDLSGKDLDIYQEITVGISEGTEEFTLPAGGQNRVFFQVNQNKYNLSACALMPQALLAANQRSLTISLLTIAIVMVAITLIITYICSKSLTQPLETLTDMTERIKQGETELRVQVNKRDEIGELGTSFNEMLDQIQALLVQEYENKLLLNRAEYNALQAQINPHFFYNTMDTMSSIAQIHHCEEVSYLCQSLSNIFRYSLDMKNPFSTVSQELVHLKNYIYVMNVRMQGSVSYEFDIDDAALKDTVPKICMQPLVENALNHGLRNARREKRIAVKAKIQEEKLMITVEDNGVGLTCAEELNRKMAANDLELVAEGNSIGLININARVKMLYGDAYGITVSSRPGEGTRVELLVARMTMEEVGQWQENSIKS